jgi:hypothetical protein
MIVAAAAVAVAVVGFDFDWQGLEALQDLCQHFQIPDHDHLEVAGSVVG